MKIISSYAARLLLELRHRSLDVPADELGAIAVEMAMARLAQELAPEVRLLQPRLTGRGSTATR